MLRGPLKASLPSLDPFSREAGASCNVYPLSARSASPLSSQPVPRYAVNIASSTFWRSPYSEALRQSRPSAPSKAECEGETNRAKTSVAASLGERQNVKEEEDGGNQTKGILKVSGDSKDSASDISIDNARHIRGILCKSSLSCCSRQSAGKVQKRVKFDESVDKVESSQSLRQTWSANSGCVVTSHSNCQQRQRSKSAVSAAKSMRRIPFLRHSEHFPHPTEKHGMPHLPSYQNQLHNPHQYPHIPRPNSGPLIHTCNVPELTMPRPTCRSGSQLSGQAMSSPHSALSIASTGHSTTSSLSPTHVEVKTYRKPAHITSRAGLTVSQSGSPQTRPSFVVGRCHGRGTRSLVRLARSFTSPCFSIQRPIKRNFPSASSRENSPFMSQNSRTGVSVELQEKCDMMSEVLMKEAQKQGQDKGADRRDSYLDDDKTVQILHWLKEVGHRHIRERSCPQSVEETCDGT